MNPNLRIHKIYGPNGPSTDPANVTRTDASHYCKDCGAVWAFFPGHHQRGTRPDGSVWVIYHQASWSVRSDYGDCCDKGDMDIQMIPLQPKNRPLQIK